MKTAVTVMTKSLFRHDAVKSFIALIAMVYTIIAIISCFGSLLSTEIMMVSYSSGASYTISFENLGECYKGVQIAVDLCKGDTCISTWMYLFYNSTVLDDLNIYTHDLLYPNASIGYLIADMLSTRTGTPLRICSGGTCDDIYVVWIHRNTLENAIISIAPPNTVFQGTIIYLCRYGDVVPKIKKAVANDMNRLLEVVATAIAILYIPVVVSSCIKVSRELSDEIKCLYDLGVPPNGIASSFTIAVLLTHMVSIAFGVSIGAIAFHASLWILRFVGVNIPYRPLPNPNFFTIPSAILVLATIAASYVSACKKVGAHDLVY